MQYSNLHTFDSQNTHFGKDKTLKNNYLQRNGSHFLELRIHYNVKY